MSKYEFTQQQQQPFNLSFIVGVDIALPLRAALYLDMGLDEARLDVYAAESGSFEEYQAINRINGYLEARAKLALILGSTLALRSN